MHIKRMHEMIEKLTECTKSALECDETHVGQYPISDVIEMIKELSEAEYYAKISKAMEKAEKEEEEDEKYFLKMLKEEYGMEDEDEARRFYRGQPRSRTTGRFMRRGDGRRSNRGGRRGYEEPPYWHMEPEDYEEMEWSRDMDRLGMGRMYYSGGGNAGGSRGGSSSGSGSSSSGGGSMSGGGMSVGISGGSRNYGGEYGGRSEVGRDSREGRSGQSRRSYMETKEMGKDKQEKMKELENYTKELAEDVTEMISGATPEEKNLLRTKMQTLIQKIQ